MQEEKILDIPVKVLGTEYNVDKEVKKPTTIYFKYITLLTKHAVHEMQDEDDYIALSHYDDKLDEEYDACVKNMEVAHSKSKWWNLWWYDRDIFKLDERCRRIKHELTILDLRHRSLCCFLSNSIQVEKIKEIAKTIQDAIETSRS